MSNEISGSRGGKLRIGMLRFLYEGEESTPESDVLSFDGVFEIIVRWAKDLDEKDEDKTKRLGTQGVSRERFFNDNKEKFKGLFEEINNAEVEERKKRKQLYIRFLKFILGYSSDIFRNVMTEEQDPYNKFLKSFSKSLKLPKES